MNIKSKLLWLFVLITDFFGAQVKPILRTTATLAINIFRYANSITRDTALSMRGHFINKTGSKWYFTRTSNPVWTGFNPAVRPLESDALVHWKQQSWLIDARKLLADCTCNGRFWASEIHYIKNKFRLTVNSGKVTQENPKGLKIHSNWLFVEDHFTGLYMFTGELLTKQYNNDATIF